MATIKSDTNKHQCSITSPRKCRKVLAINTGATTTTKDIRKATRTIHNPTNRPTQTNIRPIINLPITKTHNSIINKVRHQQFTNNQKLSRPLQM